MLSVSCDACCRFILRLIIFFFFFSCFILFLCLLVVHFTSPIFIVLSLRRFIHSIRMHRVYVYICSSFFVVLWLRHSSPLVELDLPFDFDLEMPRHFMLAIILFCEINLFYSLITHGKAGLKSILTEHSMLWYLLYCYFILFQMKWMKRTKQNHMKFVFNWLLAWMVIFGRVSAFMKMMRVSHRFLWSKHDEFRFQINVKLLGAVFDIVFCFFFIHLPLSKKKEKKNQTYFQNHTTE